MSLTGWAIHKRRRAKEHVAVIGRVRLAQWVLGRHAGSPVETQWKGSPHRIWVRPGTSDVQTFLQVLVGEEYDFAINDPAAIIDAGANINSWSLWLRSKFPDARVIAVEPRNRIMTSCCETSHRFPISHRSMPPYGVIPEP